MRKIRYIGPHDAVSIPLGDGSERVVENNHQIELDDDLAKSLLDQKDNWERVADTKSGSKKENS